MPTIRPLQAVLIVALLASTLPSGSATAASRPNGATCKQTTSITIRFDGDPQPYSLDTDGNAVLGPRAARTERCTSGQVSPVARTVKLGTWDFTPRKRSFSKSDVNSTFTAQSPVSPATIAWSWRPSLGVRKIARGSTIAATVERSPGNCFYSKPGVTLDYFFHSSCRNHAYYSTYKLRGHWTFRVSVNGRKGTANLNWIFQYAIVPQ